jgi:DNA-binding transcriptional MerR regulator
MKDLCRLTGLPKSTLLYYLAEGLLPEPIRTRPNVAHYHPATVDRAAFIREAQTRHRLPLAAIRKFVRHQNQGGDAALLLELQEAIFGTEKEPPLGRSAFLSATGLSESDLNRFLEIQVLRPLAPEAYGPEEVRTGRILKRGLDMGFRPEEWSYYPQLAGEMVDREMALRDRLVGGLSLDENAALTLELTRAARTIRAYALDRAFQHRVMAKKCLDET